MQRTANGPDEMPPGLRRSLERSKQKTDLNEESVSNAAVVRMASPSATTSSGLQRNSPMGGSPLTSIIDESAECMFALMDDLRAKSLIQDKIADSAEAARAAGDCAKRVYDLMRLKLDVLKYEKKG